MTSGPGLKWSQTGLVAKCQVIWPSFTAQDIFPFRESPPENLRLHVCLGRNFDDILRNKRTMQKIYDADYSFAKPPNKSRLTAVQGDQSADSDVG